MEKDLKYSELDDKERDQKLGYINHRWTQLATASGEARKEISKFVALINAGGAVAVLAFMGAIMQGNGASIGKSVLLRFALVSFISGVVACSAAGAIEHARIGALFKKWRQRVDSFYNDAVGFKTILDEDMKQASETGLVAPMFVYLALGCFVAGAICGGILLFEEIK